MRHFTWGLAIVCALGSVFVPIEAVQSQAPIKRRDTYADRSDFVPQGGTAAERVAEWGANGAGDCQIAPGVNIKIFRDGRAVFRGEVKSGESGNRYCVKLDFFDRNQLKLVDFPRFCSPFDLTNDFQLWSNRDLAIPEAHYPFIVFATRQDHALGHW
jgi:hypothetical protein